MNKSAIFFKNNKMDFIQRIFSRLFSSNTAEEHSDERPQPNRQRNSNRNNSNPNFYYEEKELQRALEESRREQVERENAKKYQSDPREMERLADLQFQEIHDVIYDPKQLKQILRKLPNVDPNNKIFIEFYHDSKH